MQLLVYLVFSGAIVAADQITKYLTVANIALYEDVPFVIRAVIIAIDYAHGVIQLQAELKAEAAARKEH